MTNLEHLIRDLKSEVANKGIAAVAKGCGVHRNTIYQLVNDINDNPRYKTMMKIWEYLYG